MMLGVPYFNTMKMLDESALLIHPLPHHHFLYQNLIPLFCLV